MEVARQSKATLLVAKLDRLSRDVEFIAGVIKRCDLIVASMPNADKFQLHIYAALAWQELLFISLRTKAALAEAKAGGVKLGGTRPEAEVRHAAVKAKSEANAERIRTILSNSRAAGMTYKAIADELNKLGVATATGSGKWHDTTVRRYALKLLT